ncbi:MAG: processive 1,2-diacylglycerol beta-glucosyltransferase [Candidatus Petromonas sp.]|nr:processive 1,2-diacylglycerol beta-glucosyltransferase [Candidatus Petromonas sp.]
MVYIFFVGVNSKYKINICQINKIDMQNYFLNLNMGIGGNQYMKKVVILTASTGGGHNQAARSLENVFQSHGYEVTIIDFLKVTSKMMDKIFVEGYSILSNNLPRVYKGLYKYSNYKVVNSRITNYMSKIFHKRIFKVINEINPDLIVGTHPFIVNIICKLKEKGKLLVPFISVITDFKAHRIYVNNYVDAYITGSEYTSLSMIKKGINKEKVYTYGIPIRREFLRKSSTKTYRNNEVFTVLLMGGSMGYRAIEDVLRGLVNSKNKIKIIVVCGRNKSLMENIKVNYQNKYKNKEIIVYGFTEDIPKLMESSDLLISKPGGLTVSEAIAKRLPMLIPYMIPGQEEENAEFLAQSGVARIIDDINEIDKEIDGFINNQYVLKRMEKNMEKLSEDYSLDDIVRLGDKLIEKYKVYYNLKRAR